MCPPRDIITRDNVSVSVDAVVYFRVVDPVKAIVDVENYLYATSPDSPNYPQERLRFGGAG
jgi:regulator of protease activity HflC (stomatin/prohibitin superfamily)